MTRAQKLQALAPPRPTRLGFGRFSGWSLSQVPSWYLLWVCQKIPGLRPELDTALRVELEARRMEPGHVQEARDQEADLLTDGILQADRPRRRESVRPHTP